MRFRNRTLLLLFLLSIITYLDRVCISVAGPRMQAEMGITPEMWGWVVGAFTLGYAIFEIPSGLMADRIGARRVLTRIVLWWSAFTAATGIARGFGPLLAIRFLFGAGEAGAYPGATSAVSRWFPKTERSRSAGVIWMASRLGAMLSPLLVVPIQQRYGWRASFLAFAGVGVVWAGAWYAWFRDRPQDKKGVTPEELAEIAASSSPAAHARMPWAHVLRQRNFWLLLAMYHAYCWGSYFYISWLHTYLQKGRGMTEDQMKIWSTLPFIVGACSCVFGGWISDRLVARWGLTAGRRWVGTLGLGLGSVALLGTAFAPSGPTAALCLTVGYLCMDCFLPVSWAVALDVGREYAGGISGAMNMAGQVGSFVSSVAFGYMVKSFGDYNRPLIPLAIVTAVGAVIFWRVDAAKPVVPVAAP